jgi:hypothetical protein
MIRAGKSASRAALRLCPPPEKAPRAALCALPPSRGQYVLHGLDCRIVRRCDGVLGCYVRVPYTHDLHGQTDLSELSAVLACEDEITYAAGGADGWFIGSATQSCWNDARALLGELARQIAGLGPSKVWSTARVHRLSGIQFTVLSGGKCGATKIG